MSDNPYEKYDESVFQPVSKNDLISDSISVMSMFDRTVCDLRSDELEKVGEIKSEVIGYCNFILLKNKDNPLEEATSMLAYHGINKFEMIGHLERALTDMKNQSLIKRNETDQVADLSEVTTQSLKTALKGVEKEEPAVKAATVDGKKTLN